MQRLRYVRRMTTVVIVVSLLAVLGIALLRGNSDQEGPEHEVDGGAGQPTAQHGH